MSTHIVSEASSSAALVKQHFNEYSTRYHDSAFSGTGMAFVSGIELDAVCTAAEMAGSGRAVDVGVGTGRISSVLCASGYQLTGVDVSAGMLAQAALRLPDAVLLEGSITEQLPVPDASAELVTCMRVLKYIPDVQHAIGELARVTDAGGVVCFDLANRWSVARFGYPDGLVRLRSFREVADAVKANGLTIVEVRNGVHLPDPLWRAASGSLVGRGLIGLQHLLWRVLGRHGARSWTVVARKESAAA